jgi:predicted RNA-binding protein with PUA-like domain
MPPRKKTKPRKRRVARKSGSTPKPAARPRAPAAKKGGAWDAAFAARSPGERRYWLVKSEPEVFSFDDLLRTINKTTHWNGIRNFAARNFLRDGMKLGDRVFFYHSMSDSPGIVGICEVVREGYPDDTAFDSASEGYDPKSVRDKPTWFMVDLRAVAQLTHPVTLAEIKQRRELAGMALLRIGRLSVSPVTADEWTVITRMADES